jgi:hypothetical protein
MNEQEFHRVLSDLAPKISEERVDRLTRSIMHQISSAPHGTSLPRWASRWNIHPQFVYPWMFVLGCLANLLMRVGAGRTPVDLLFSANLLNPFGG